MHTPLGRGSLPLQSYIYPAFRSKPCRRLSAQSNAIVKSYCVNGRTAGRPDGWTHWPILECTHFLSTQKWKQGETSRTSYFSVLLGTSRYFLVLLGTSLYFKSTEVCLFPLEWKSHMRKMQMYFFSLSFYLFFSIMLHFTFDNHILNLFESELNKNRYNFFEWLYSLLDEKNIISFLLSFWNKIIRSKLAFLMTSTRTIISESSSTNGLTTIGDNIRYSRIF